MAVKRYLFDALPGSKLIVGDTEHDPGAEVELDESLAIAEPRLREIESSKPKTGGKDKSGETGAGDDLNEGALLHDRP